MLLEVLVTEGDGDIARADKKGEATAPDRVFPLWLPREGVVVIGSQRKLERPRPDPQDEAIRSLADLDIAIEIVVVGAEVGRIRQGGGAVCRRGVPLTHRCSLSFSSQLRLQRRERNDWLDHLKLVESFHCRIQIHMCLVSEEFVAWPVNVAIGEEHCRPREPGPRLLRFANQLLPLAIL